MKRLTKAVCGIFAVAALSAGVGGCSLFGNSNDDGDNGGTDLNENDGGGGHRSSRSDL